MDLKNTNYLPNNDTYALNYVDLKNFDTKSLTGNVEMIDLNYDNFVHSTISIENNNITKWNSNGLSSELSLKYQMIKKPKALTFPSMRSGITIGVNNKITTLKLPIYTLCDTNGDNNISFSECYKCASDAVTANGFASFVCDFPLLGWLSCWGSKTATCIYISAKY